LSRLVVQVDARGSYWLPGSEISQLRSRVQAVV
jgi:hypothetical protein